MSLQAAQLSSLFTAPPAVFSTISAHRVRNVALRAKKQLNIEEMNLDDTIGVDNLLERDFKIVELKGDGAFDDAPEDSDEDDEENSSSTSADNEDAEGRPRRSKEAIAAGLDLFSQGNYKAAIDMFQLALELPGSGVMRMAGSPKEISCSSEGEEQAALYNMACCWGKLGASAAAITCLTSLLEDTEFDDFNAVRTDPDLSSVRGPELDALLSK